MFAPRSAPLPEVISGGPINRSNAAPRGERRVRKRTGGAPPSVAFPEWDRPHRAQRPRRCPPSCTGKSNGRCVRCGHGYASAMLHLRMITPAGRTERVVGLLEKTIGTAHIAVLPGAARSPAGDVVMCDVAREAADGLMSRLRELGLVSEGSVAVENIDLSLSDRAEQAELDAPGAGVDAVLWESLTDATHEESQLSLTYLTFLTVATMLAACGVVT